MASKVGKIVGPYRGTPYQFHRINQYGVPGYLIGAVVGGLAGGVLGTFLLPIPVIGSLAGICLGAGLGTYLMEWQGGNAAPAALRSGAGAGIGRLAGTVVKTGIGAVIWLVVVIALIWP